MSMEDFETLVDAILPTAQGLLAENDRFTPFGGVLSPDGTVELFQAEEDDDADPDDIEEAALEVLIDNFRAMAADGELRSVALCFNAEVAEADESAEDPPTIDAIYVCLEHVEGDAVDLYRPYDVTEDGELSFGEVKTSAAPPRILAGADDEVDLGGENDPDFDIADEDVEDGDAVGSDER